MAARARSVSSRRASTAASASAGAALITDCTGDGALAARGAAGRLVSAGMLAVASVGLSAAFSTGLSAGFSTTTAFSAAAFFSSTAFSEMPLALTPEAGMPAISASGLALSGFALASALSALFASDLGWAGDTTAAFGVSVAGLALI